MKKALNNGNTADSLLMGFPKTLRREVIVVSKLMSLINTSYGCIPYQTEQRITVNVMDEIIQFPDRVYYLKLSKILIGSLSHTQQIITYCIYTRSNDGYTRQKAAEKLLNLNKIPYWTLPYIFKLCDEYVIEIIELIAANINRLDSSEIKMFVNENKAFLRLGYDRMISYWNCYYRSMYPSIKEYVGYKLYNGHFLIDDKMILSEKRSKKETAADI